MKKEWIIIQKKINKHNFNTKYYFINKFLLYIVIFLELPWIKSKLKKFWYFSSCIFWFFEIFIMLNFCIWFYYLKWTYYILVNLHNCTIVLELTTIIWSWEYCYKLSISEKLISLLNYLKIFYFIYYLMRSANKIEIIVI